MRKKGFVFTVILVFAMLLANFHMVSAASGIAISKSSMTITSGQTYQLQVTVDGKATDAFWSSSDASVASVNSSGLVTGKAAGSAVIKATVDQVSVECLVSVLKKTQNTTYRYNVLILDASGSIKGQPHNSQKLAAKRFCKKVLETKGSNYVSIVAMNSSPTLVCKFTNNYSKLCKYIDRVQAKGDTNINGALELAEKQLKEIAKKNKTAIKNVVLCSDGLPTVGKSTHSGRYQLKDHKWYKYANAAYNTAKRMKSEKQFIYALGFFHNSSKVDLKFGKRLMADLASKDKYYIIQDSKDLDEVFDDVANVITKTTLNKKSVTLYTGGTFQLQAMVNGIAQKATWKSSSPSVVKVTETGKILGKKPGKATITAKVNGTNLTCNVVVKSKHRYKVFNKSRTWKQAKADCEKLGGHLVTITSAAEQKKVEELIAKQSRNFYWMGMIRDEKNQFSKWITGETMKYTHFDTQNREPNNYGGKENVLVIYRIANPRGGSSGQLKWNDLAENGECNNESFFGIHNSGYICEWD